MAPASVEARISSRSDQFGNWRDTLLPETFIVEEGWSEGFMLGALLIMALITIVNMRRKVGLHKVILLELLLAMGQGTFCFMGFKGYGWYLSSTAALLYSAYFVHNIVAWLKVRPFFISSQCVFRPGVCKWVCRIYLTTLVMSAPALIFQIFNNFRFFNNQSTLYKSVRPYEPLMRDPWWIFSCLVFFHVIQRSYSLGIFQMVVKSPRFGILLVAMFLAVVFTIMDVLASVVNRLIGTDGINPYWKIALVFKCLSDNIILDNFQLVLQQLQELQLEDVNAAEQFRNRSLDHSNPRPQVAEIEEIRNASSFNIVFLDDINQNIQGHAASTPVGRLGMKIGRLPRIKQSDLR